MSLARVGELKMKLSFKGLSSNAKLLIVFILIVLYSAYNYRLFSDKLERISLFDDLANRLNSIKTSVITLEYTLDMFIVAERFEDTTVALIKRDVERLDRSISDATGNPRFRKVVAENGLLSDGLTSIANEWSTTLSEISRLNEATTKEELMLTHNTVDMHTILVTEVADRLIGVISESRNNVYGEIKSLIFKNLSAAVLFFIAAALFFAKRISVPAVAINRAASSISSGDLTARFGGYGSGLMGTLAEGLNSMLDRLNSEISSRTAQIDDLGKSLGVKDGQIAALNTLSSYESKSLSQSEILSSAAQLALKNARADAAAVYVREEKNFRLGASAGFDDFFVREASLIPEGAFGADEGRDNVLVYEDAEALPYEKLGKLLKSCAFKGALVAPLRFAGETAGFLLVSSREGSTLVAEARFFESLASNLSVFVGQIGMFYREHNSKKFLERVLNQVPVGFAVFDKSGVCVLANSMIKRMLCADTEAGLVGEYRVFDDDVLKAQGMLTSIRKSYDGYSTEFIINYNPSLVERFSFSGPARRLKIRSIPLYDTNGEISNIALLYEDITESPEREGAKA